MEKYIKIEIKESGSVECKCEGLLPHEVLGLIEQQRAVFRFKVLQWYEKSEKLSKKENETHEKLMD